MRALLLLSAFAVSCNGGSSLRCIDNGDCEGIAVCNEVGLCEAVECTQPDQCTLGSTCSEQNTCIVGCSGDNDCLAGQTCNSSNQCEAYGCRSTNLDCNYGERCEPASGQCATDTAPHCLQGCTSDIFGDSCSAQSPGATCACFEASATQCLLSYCLVQCDSGAAEPCPRGYQCQQAFVGDPTTFCRSDCDFISQF